MKKVLRLQLLFMAFCPFVVNAQKTLAEKSAAYINQYKNWAISEQQRTGVPAAIKLAQGLYETGAGESDLCMIANNHFGIKCKSSWKGKTFHKDDDAKDECFRSYGTAMDSYKDHSDFLKNNARYAALFALRIDDYQGWCKGLKSCGYATNPVYAQRLIKIIEENNLNEITQLALQATPKEIVPVEPTQTKYNSSYFIPAENDHSIVLINNLRAVYCKRGTPLLDVAMEHKIRYAKLLEMNDLPDAPLPFDMYVYLQRKPTKGIRATHTLKQGETLLHVAQGEGVQLASILQYNHLKAGDQPTVGSELYLQEPTQLKPTLVAKAEQKEINRQSNQNDDDYVQVKETTTDYIVKNNATTIEDNQPSRVAPSKQFETVKLKEQEQEEQVVVSNDRALQAPVEAEVVTTTQEVAPQEQQPVVEETKPTNSHASTMAKEELNYEETVPAEVEEKVAAIANSKKETKLVEEVKQAEEEPQDEFSKLQRKLDRIVYKEPAKTTNTTASNTTVKTNTTTVNTKATTPSESTETTISKPNTASAGTAYHVVKKGETAYAIAKQYGVSMKQLMQWNGLSFQELKVGQKLKVQP